MLLIIVLILPELFKQERKDRKLNYKFSNEMGIKWY